MAAQIYFKTPEEIALMDFDDMELCFDLGEGDFVFGFSPSALRAACDKSAKIVYLLANHLTARHCAPDVDTINRYERPGFARPLSDHEWFGKMRQIAQMHLADEIFLFDFDEVGYAEARAAEDARLAEKAMRRKVKEDAAVKSQAARGISDEKSKTAPTDVGIQEGNSGPKSEEVEIAGKPLLIQEKLYNGQLNISNLITGSCLVSIGSDSRQTWTAKNPLVVSKISGIEAGTTTVEYIGEELHVGDIETWATAIRFGAKFALETTVTLSERELLKAMRRSDGGMYYRTLREQISRLQNGKITITTTHVPTIKAMAAAMPEDEAAQDAIKSGQLKIVISLLGDSASSATEKKPGVLSVHISKQVRALFGAGLSSWFKEDVYYSLRSRTSRRLFLLYGRHANPWPFTRDELKEYLGSTSGSSGDFKKTLDRAFAEMLKKGIIAQTPKYAASDRRHGAKAYQVTLGKLYLENGEIVTA